MNRHTQFPEIKGLDNELDLILRSLKEFTGKLVAALPPIQQIPEMARFIVKNTEGNYEEYIKLNGKYNLLNGDASISETIINEVVVANINQLIADAVKNFMIVTVGKTVDRPIGLDIENTGKVSYYDVDTQGWVVWQGLKWSDQP